MTPPPGRTLAHLALRQVAGRWWRLSLRARLSLIAAAAVAAAVLAVSGLAWVVVRAELYRQLDLQLTSDARTIAAQPARWRRIAPRVDETGARRRGPNADDDRDVGPRWQLLDATGAVQPGAGVPPVLPVTPAARRVAAGTSPRVRQDVDIDGFTYRMLTRPLAGGGAVQVALPRDPVDHTLGMLSLVLMVGCVAGVAAAALLGRQVARAGLAPVERLTRAVEQVATTQDLHAAIPVDGQDEIARLAGSVNAMLAALESSRAAQRLLVEDAGHELRTPLTSLRTNIELLVHAESGAAAGRQLAADDRARLLQDLQVQVVELAALTGELVELAREDASPEPMHDVDLVEVVRSAAERVRLRASGVPFDLSLEPVTMRGRAAALERMVLNLLDNAAKWSPAGAAVVVRLGTAHDGVRSWATLTVADSGPGIEEEEDRPRVFERFYRATRARAMPGSGLGLAIVAQAVSQHGGSVDVGRSSAGGALMTVRLPTRIPGTDAASSD